MNDARAITECRLVRDRKMLFGEQLAKSIIDMQTKRTAQAACAACAQADATRHAVVFGQPVALCDEECYVMLIANWQRSAAITV